MKFYCGYMGVTICALAFPLFSASAADYDWTGTTQKLENFQSSPTFSSSEKSFLDNLNRQVSALHPDQMSPEVVNATLSLAELEQKLGSADTYSLLSEISEAKSLNLHEAERLAVDYLAIDLPWQARDLLTGRKADLDQSGQQALDETNLALEVIQEDSVSIAPTNIANSSDSPLVRRLTDLIGIPPYEGGAYSDMTADIASPRDDDSDSDTLNIRSHIDYAEPLLAAEFDSKPPTQIEDGLSVSSTSLLEIPLVSGVSEASLAQLAQPTTGPIAVSHSEATSLVAQASIGGTSFDGLMTFSRVVQFRGGAIVFFNVDGDNDIDVPALVITVSAQTAVRIYRILVASPSSVRIIDVGNGFPQLMFQSIVMDVGDLTLQIFDPENKTLWTFGNPLPHGEAFLLTLGTPSSFLLLINSATDDYRFDDCVQCATRRIAALFRFDPTSRAYIALGERETGTDMFTSTYANVFGISAEAAYDPAEQAAVMARLSDRSPMYLKKDLDDDVTAIISIISQKFSDDNNFSAEIHELNEVIELLSGNNSDQAVYRERARVQIALLQALLSNGQDADAAKLALDPALQNSVGSELDYISAAMAATLSVGDYSDSYQFLTKWRSKPDASSEGMNCLFLEKVGDLGDAESSCFHALDLATATGGGQPAAIDMLLLAIIDEQLGQPNESLNWISRALRISRGLGDSNLDTIGLGTAADIALQNKQPKIAIILLDQALITTDGPTWSMYGDELLLLYGRTLEQLGENSEADGAYKAAIAIGRPERGSILTTALSLRSRLAATEGNLPLALQLASDAFGNILGGRSRIGQEGFKLSFIATSESVADQFFSLAVKSGMPPGQLFDNVEAWRLQVFKDEYARLPETTLIPHGVGESIQNVLGNDTVYVAFSIGSDSSFVILVTKSGIYIRPLNVTRSAITMDIVTINKWLDLSDPEALEYINADRVPPEMMDSLRRLYDELITPLQLQPSDHYLVVSPDETLSGLPWGALMEPTTGSVSSVLSELGFQVERPLYEDYAVSVVPSASVLLSGQRTSGSSGQQVGLIGAFGSVPSSEITDVMPLAFGSMPATNLPALTHGPDELLAVIKDLGSHRTKILLDSSTRQNDKRFPSSQVALKESVVDLFQDSSIIHIAGHAIFNDTTPMQSAIFLDSGSHSVLTAEDFLSMNLSSTKLVVMSACETGQGTVAVGGETFGFLRGLMGAGAKSAILTLWSVDDAATASFFASFYNNLQNHPTSEALRLAALSEMAKRKHPFYWAAPTLYGWWQ